MNCWEVLEELQPRLGNVPRKERWQEIAKRMEADGKSLHEVTYTWNEGELSLEVGLGAGDKRLVPGTSRIHLVKNGELYPYAVFYPQGYDAQEPGRKWPLIFFFHGIGERGDDPAILLREGLPYELAQGRGVDALVIAPQCPADSHWADQEDELIKLRRFLPAMMEKYPVDPDRIYITGLSMGGRCAWKVALDMPDTFAAMVVACGRTSESDLGAIRDMPLWMFHGVNDSTTSFDNINAILPRLQASQHRHYKLSVYPQVGHNVWGEAYTHMGVFDWLLTQRRSRNREFAAGRKNVLPTDAKKKPV